MVVRQRTQDANKATDNLPGVKEHRASRSGTTTKGGIPFILLEM